MDTSKNHYKIFQHVNCVAHSNFLTAVTSQMLVDLLTHGIAESASTHVNIATHLRLPFKILSLCILASACPPVGSEISYFVFWQLVKGNMLKKDNSMQLKHIIFLSFFARLLSCCMQLSFTFIRQLCGKIFPTRNDLWLRNGASAGSRL